MRLRSATERNLEEIVEPRIDMTINMPILNLYLCVVASSTEAQPCHKGIDSVAWHC